MSSLKEISFKSPLKSVSIHHWGSSYITLKEAQQKEIEAVEKAKQSTEALLNEKIQALNSEIQQLQTQVFSGITKQFDEFAQNINERLPRLVTSIAGRVLGKIEQDDESIMHIVKEAIEEAPQDSRSLVMMLCPRDYQLMQKNIEQLKQEFPQITIAENKALQSGDCIIESDFGVIDAKVSTKLKKIEENLKGE